MIDKINTLLTKDRSLDLVSKCNNMGMKQTTVLKNYVNANLCIFAPFLKIENIRLTTLYCSCIWLTINNKRTIQSSPRDNLYVYSLYATSLRIISDTWSSSRRHSSYGEKRRSARVPFSPYTSAITLFHSQPCLPVLFSLSNIYQRSTCRSTTTTTIGSLKLLYSFNSTLMIRVNGVFRGGVPLRAQFSFETPTSFRVAFALNGGARFSVVQSADKVNWSYYPAR